MCNPGGPGQGRVLHAAIDRRRAWTLMATASCREVCSHRENRETLPSRQRDPGLEIAKASGMPAIRSFTTTFPPAADSRPRGREGDSRHGPCSGRCARPAVGDTFMHCPSLNLFGTFFPSWMLCALRRGGGGCGVQALRRPGNSRRAGASAARYSSVALSRWPSLSGSAGSVLRMRIAASCASGCRRGFGPHTARRRGGRPSSLLRS